jgi:hypothetical protein
MHASILRNRYGAFALAAAVAIGSAGVVATTFTSGAGATTASPTRRLPTPPPALPPGLSIKCSQISGNFTMNPGVGATSSSSGVKWKVVAVANNCTNSTNSAYGGSIIGAIIKGSGYIVPNNKCPTAATAANYGASTLKVQWIAAPAVSASTWSTVATGAFLPVTTLDATGLTQGRLNTGPTPVQVNWAGDWTAASAAQLATDCGGTPPPSRVLSFSTGTSHSPAFFATT